MAKTLSDSGPMGACGWVAVRCGATVLGRMLFGLNVKFVTVCGQNSLSDSGPMGVAGWLSGFGRLFWVWA